MDFTSNLRVSCKAPGTSRFLIRNPHFRIAIPSNDGFQTEKFQLSISSNTYPNRFKVLTNYSKSNGIYRIYLYSDQEVISGEMVVLLVKMKIILT